MTYGIPSRFAFSFTSYFVEKLEAAHGKTIAYAVEEAMRIINNAEDRIQVNIIWIEGKIESIRSSLAKSQNLNELGEFQGNGAGEIDRYCAIRYYAWQTLVSLLTKEELAELQNYRNEKKEH